MTPIKIKFWGVRGSIPTPGPQTIRYGGNTSCVEIQFPGQSRFIVDAGSGIRELGKNLMETAEACKAYIFLSHFHWDHIQGLPFFKPAFVPDNHLIIFGCDEPDVELNQIIKMQMNPIYFPVAVDDMRAQIDFRPIQAESTITVEEVQVRTKFLNHPGYTLGYRFEFQDKAVVYISDNEPFVLPHPNTREQDTLEDRFESFVDNKEEVELVSFIHGADVLIHDAQYFPEEYQQKISWGHSPYTYTVDLAVRGEVKQLVLFHHDPDHDDATVDRIAELSRRRLNQKSYPIPCKAAQEGDVIII